MRVLFFGNSSAAILCLQKLIKKKYLLDILVVTPTKGKYHYWHVSLADYCRKHKIDYVSPSNVNSTVVINKFKNFKPDIIFSIYYTQILSNKILKLAKYRVNFHPSLLPKYRGRAPLIWAIINGERKTGISVHEMTSKVDRGKIYIQEEIEIGFFDTGYQLHKKAAKKTIAVFEQLLSRLRNNTLTSFYPKGRGSCYSSKTPRVNQLQPTFQSGKKIYNIVRALAAPLPRAYLEINDKRYFINKVSFVDKRLEKKLKKKKLEKKDNLLRIKNNLYIRAKNGFLKIEEYEI